MIEVYGASYFYEGDPETPVVALWVRRGTDTKIREIRIPYAYFGPGDTVWTRLHRDMLRPFVDRESWQYDYYRDMEPFFHMESAQPIHIPEPEDSESAAVEK